MEQFLLQLLPSLMSNFKGSSSPFLKQQKQLAGQQANYANALADPSSGIYTNLYKQNQQMGQEQLAQAVSEIQGQNRRGANMGRGNLLDSERGGESIFRNLMKGYQDIGNQAHTQTRGDLQAALQGGNTALAGFSNVTPYANSVEAQKLSGFDTLAGILKSYKNEESSGDSQGMDWSKILQQIQPQSGYGGY